MSGLVNSIKNDVKKAGTSKSNFTYIREGQKVRVRFLQDMDDGMEVTFHDSFAESINVPCQEIFDRECPYCEDDRVRTRSQYVWCVYNYESKKVELFMFAVNNCSPVPSLLAMYETYGTIMDRDYVISVSGKGPDKKYAVVPMDKAKFRNEKAKPFAEKKILQLLDKAYPCDGAEDGDDDDDEEDFPMNKPSNSSKKAGKNNSAGKSSSKTKNGRKNENTKSDDDDDYDDDQDWGDDEDEAPDYSEMSAKELYKLCKERDLDVEAKKPQKYYIKQLEAADKAEEDWGDESDDDDEDWEDE